MHPFPEIEITVLVSRFGRLDLTQCLMAFEGTLLVCGQLNPPTGGGFSAFFPISLLQKGAGILFGPFLGGPGVEFCSGMGKTRALDPC